MATYFHQHHHHNSHHHSHHGNTSDIITPQASDGGLQTLILMNHPNFVGYSEPHAPTLYHTPPPLLPQLVGVPLHPSSESYAPTQSSHAQQQYSAWAQRESPRAQQGLSLTLSSNQNHSFSRAAHAEPDHLQPSPSGGSDSPAATTVASAGDVAALMTPSKYLKAVQELLEEVVNVSVDRVKPDSVKKVKITKGESQPDDSVAGHGPKEPAELTPADRQELQMKKAKLINLLDEVDQRQRQYHQQMQSVVASFEQVAGANSARTYTSLALKTISSQFRCLRGAISGQIRAANKALGEGEGEGAGPTSRLKMLDHQMRQQRALQQLGMIQNNAWRPQRGLPEKAVSVLRAWLFEHFLHPYPKDSDKIMLAKQTGLSRSQVSNWFINARVRLWKPMIEEMYAEEVKEHQQQNGTDNKDEPDAEKDDHYLGVGDDDAKAGENHSSSNVKGNNDPFALVDNEAQGSCLKKQRNYDFTFPESEMFNNGCKEEQVVHHQTKEDDDCPIMPGSGSGFMGGLVSYPIGEIGRFGDDGQFSANFSGNGVSLTLGLPHCESLSLQGNNQAFLTNNSGIDQYRGRLEMGQLNPNSSHSGNAYGAQLLHDFVA